MKRLTPFQYILNLILPRICIVCGRDLLLHERHICTACLADLPKTHFEHMDHNPMADMLNARLDSGKYSYATSLFYYRGDFVEISKALKYHRNFQAGEYFAELLADNIRQSEHFADVDLITAVPLHWTRRLRRGYNQAEIIARAVARKLDVVYSETLVRSRKTDRQAKIGGENELENRLNNVQGAFKTRGDILKTLENKKHVMIIDDVFTTGATLSECVKTLKTVQKAEISISVASIGFAKY